MVYLWFASLFACDDTTFKAHFASVDGEGVEAVVEVFEGNCVDCHMGESGSAGLALDGNFCDTTVNVESVSGTGLLIVPGSKEDSVLYQRIVDASRPMPPTGVMAENNTNIVGQWIDDGADCSDLGSGGTEEPNDTASADTDMGDGPEAAAAQVMADSCVGCHSGPRPSGGFGLDENLCDQVVNQVGSSGGLLVVPNDADASLLYQRMLDYEAPMPPSGLLDQSDTDAVKDWINSGAECGEEHDSDTEEDPVDGEGADSGSDGDATEDPGTETPDDTGDSTTDDETVDAPVPTFTDVYLILDSESTHCTACHDDTRPAAGLGMHTQEEAYENLLADPPGVLGPLVVPGDAEASPLVMMMRGDPYYPPMPPTDGTGYALVSPIILGVVIDWINGGAPE